MVIPCSAKEKSVVEIRLADASPAAAARGWQWLDATERGRAESFRHPGGRDLFVVARATLRAALSRKLEVAPDRLRFGFSPRGKPLLAVPWIDSGWHFNLAHSGRLAVVALARGFEVGVDLERVDAIPREELDALAARYFSAGESAWRRAAADPTEAFFRIWTRKEAVLKASGEGLVDDLAAVDTIAGPVVSGRWVVRDLAAPAGYVASIAAAGADWEANLTLET